MSREGQKLVGYIIYDIWTYQTRSHQDEKWEHQVITPEVHWKKKIYLTLKSAQEAAKHLEGKNLAKAVIVPIYANYEDLNKVKDGVNELKTEIEKLKYTNQDN